ncbi:MAG: hypothetical protein KDN19_10415 [Verrucomicrobiae bacterium]|nr:hypothetical protein [Verrucomicrobiae bacterium]
MSTDRKTSDTGTIESIGKNNHSAKDGPIVHFVGQVSSSHNEWPSWTYDLVKTAYINGKRLTVTYTGTNPDAISVTDIKVHD